MLSLASNSHLPPSHPTSMPSPLWRRACRRAPLVHPSPFDGGVASISTSASMATPLTVDTDTVPTGLSGGMWTADHAPAGETLGNGEGDGGGEYHAFVVGAARGTSGEILISYLGTVRERQRREDKHEMPLRMPLPHSCSVFLTKV